VLKTEGLVLESMPIGRMGAGCQAKLPIVGICMVWVKEGKAMHIIGPRSHKATKAERFRGNTWKDIKWMSQNNIRELRHHSGGRWRHIPSLRGRISVRRSRRKSRGSVMAGLP